MARYLQGRDKTYKIFSPSALSYIIVENTHTQANILRIYNESNEN